MFSKCGTEFKVNFQLGELISPLPNTKAAKITLGGSSRSLGCKNTENIHN